VTVPSDAVFDAASDRAWVLVAYDGRAVKRPIRLGLRGEGRVEVLEGLTPGERVIPTAAGIRAGQRVRPVAADRRG
jgi:HlyD family secretion protein